MKQLFWIIRAIFAGAFVRLSLGGGSGGGGSTQTSEFKAPLWTMNQWPDLVEAGTRLASEGRQQYPGQRIAGINNTQAQGMQYLADLSGNTSPDMAAARRNLQATAAGAYENPYSLIQTQLGENPFASEGSDATFYNPALGQSSLRLSNPFLNEQTLIPGFDRRTGMANLENANGYIGDTVNVGDARTYGKGTPVQASKTYGKGTPVGASKTYGKGTPVDPDSLVRSALGNRTTPVDDNPFIGQTGAIGTNDYIGKTADIGNNKHLGLRTKIQDNEFGGYGAAYQSMKDHALGDVVKHFQTAVNPGTQSAFNRAGAFGGGAHIAADAANKDSLARNLARASSEMDEGQFARSADLRQQNIGLDANAQMSDYARNVGAEQNWLGYKTQAQQNDLGRNADAQQDWLSYMTQAQQNDLSRNMAGMQSMSGLRNQSAQQDAQRNLSGAQAFEQMRLGSAQQDIGRDADTDFRFENMRLGSAQQDINRDADTDYRWENMRLGSAQQDIARDANTDFQWANMRAQNEQQNIGRNLGAVQDYNKMLVDAQQGDLGRQTTGFGNYANMVASSTGADLGRDVSGYNDRNQQYANWDLADRSRMGNLTQQGLQMGFDAQTRDLDRAGNAWESGRDRQMAAFNPILAANQFEQQNARNLTSIGDWQRGYTQDNMNVDYMGWQDAMNYPETVMNNYGNLLSRASGNYGTNQTTYNQAPYRANPFAVAGGAAMAGAAAYNSGMFG